MQNRLLFTYEQVIGDCIANPKEFDKYARCFSLTNVYSLRSLLRENGGVN